VAFILFTTILYFGILSYGNETDRATIGKQSLFFGFCMAIFEVLVFEKMKIFDKKK
jgi:hypothetical protein